MYISFGKVDKNGMVIEIKEISIVDPICCRNRAASSAKAMAIRSVQAARSDLNLKR